MMHLLIIDNKSDALEISLFGYERESVGNYYDDNWLRCQVDFTFSHRHYSYNASFITREFIDFLSELKRFSKKQITTAHFNTIEQALTLVFSWGEDDSIVIKGNASVSDDYNEECQFESKIKSSRLPFLIEQLESLVSAFPER